MAINVINLSSDEEDETPPPARPKNNSTSARYQQAPIANEAPNVRSFSGLNTDQAQVELADNPFLSKKDERPNSVVEVEKQTMDVPKASFPNGNDSGSGSMAGANQNGHLLAEDGNVVSGSHFTSSHDQDINPSPAAQPGKPRGQEGPEGPLYTFRKHKHRNRFYRTRRPVQEEHADSANNMRHTANPEARPPPSAGLLRDSRSPSKSPKPEREPQRLPRQTVDLTKDENVNEFEGQDPIVEVRRLPPNLNKAHCSETKKPNGSISGPVRTRGGEEEGSKRQRGTLDLSEDEQVGNYKRAKQNNTAPRELENNLRELYQKKSSLREPPPAPLPPPPTKTMPSGNFGAFRPHNAFKTRDDANQINAKPQHSVGKHFDFSGYSQPPVQDEHHPKKQKTSHNGSEKEVSEMGTNVVQNHRPRRQSTAASGLSYPETEKRPEGFLSTKDMMKPKRARNRNQGSSGHPHTNGGAQQFKRPSPESQHRNGEVPGDPIYDELSNHGEEFKKPNTTPQVQLPGHRVGGHKGITKQRSPPQEERESNIRRPRQPPPGADVSPYFTSKRGRTLASGAKDPDKEFDQLNEEYYPEGPEKKQPPVDEHLDVQELSSDEDNEMKGHIQPSNLKGTRLQPKNGERVYTVTKVFSEKRKWLCEDSDAQWVLRYHKANKTLILHKNSSETVVWTLRTDKLIRIFHSPDSRKLIFHKSADSTDGIGTHIHLELRNNEQSESLREQLKSAYSTLGCVKKEARYLEKIFTNTIEQMPSEESKKRKGAEAPGEDIIRIGENQRRRQQDVFSHALSAKPRQAPVSKPGQNSEATPKTSGIVNAMRTRSGGVPQEPSRPEVKLRSLQPKGEFYGSAETVSDAPQSKRTSVRASGRYIAPQRAPSPPPPPPPERWSLQPQNMSWQNEWKSSLLFPPGGKNKATVDKQDIERLDEGELLNDNLLVFYLRKLEYDLQTKNPELAKRVYFQNPFFYERLTTNPPKGKRINYEAVERWTVKVNLADYDYIIVPVNENLHWYVAIICNVKKFFELAAPEPTAPLSPDLLHADRAISPSTVPDKMKGVSPTKLSDKMEDVSFADNTNTDKPKDYNGESVEDVVEGMPIANVSGREGMASPGDDMLGEIEEAPIISDIVPVHTSTSTPVSTAKQQKRNPLPARHVDTDSPRIITLDSLGSTRSATCTNLKNYLVAEIKAKTGRNARDLGRVGHTVKHIPQQDNYYDCGLFLLMYVEMFLEKGDDFIRDLIAGRQNLELDWPAASALRANIRDLLFDLQRKQVIENEKFRIQKRKDKEARAEKAGKKGGMSTTDAISIAEPGNTSMTDNGSIVSVEEVQDIPALQPRSSIGGKLQDIGSRLVKSMTRWGGSHNQHESHEVADQASTSEKIVDKSTEPTPAPKTPTSHKKQLRASSSMTCEIPDSPDLLADLTKDLALPQQSGIQANPITKSHARPHSPELGEKNPTPARRRRPGRAEAGGAHHPLVIDEDEEPAVAAPSEPVNNGASQVNHEEDELDDVMLLEISQVDTQVDPQIGPQVAAQVDSQVEAQESAESGSGPNNPQEILESPPEVRKDRQRKRHATPHPNPVHTKTRNRATSVNNQSANDKTHRARPFESSSPKKRKADSEVDGKRAPPSQNRRFHALDGADEAIIGADQLLLSIEGGRLPGNGHVGGKYTKL